MGCLARRSHNLHYAVTSFLDLRIAGSGCIQSMMSRPSGSGAAGPCRIRPLVGCNKIVKQQIALCFLSFVIKQNKFLKQHALSSNSQIDEALLIRAFCLYRAYYPGVLRAAAIPLKLSHDEDRRLT